MSWFDKRTKAEKFEDQWTATRVHESGHVLAAYLNGERVVEVAARVRSGWFSDPEPEHSAVVTSSGPGIDPWDKLIGFMSGGAAESVLYEAWGWSRGRIKREVNTHMHGDLEGIGTYFDFIGERLTDRMIRHAQAEAYGLMATYWEHVWRLAHALDVEDGRLTGDQAYAVLAG